MQRSTTEREARGELSVEAFVGLGANLGEPIRAIEAAIGALAELRGVELVARSSVYRTEPVDAVGPDFFNAAVRLRTSLPARALLDALHVIERSHGRERPYRNAPRTLDLDLLVYGDACIEESGLSVPHPRAHERAFVLRPLHEVAPDLAIPGRGSVMRLLAGVAGQRIDKLP